MTTHSTDLTDVATAIERFNDAFNRHDIDAVMDAMTPDAVFENTSPPDGERYRGPEIRAFFTALFDSAQRRFDTEEIVVAGDRATVRWIHHWVDRDGTGGHVRGVDLFTVRDGKIAAKLSYVKG